MNGSVIYSSHAGTQEQQQHRDTILSEWTRLLLAYANTIQKSSSSSNANRDLNTSFSVASYHMRQRKLLRQITVIMTQLAHVPVYSCYFIKSSVKSSQLSLLDDEEEEELKEIPDLVNKILYSVYDSLVTKSVQRQRRRCNDGKCNNATSHWTDFDNDDDDEDDDEDEEEEARENIVTSLEFLDAAFTCLDCDVMFQSFLQNHHECDSAYECAHEYGNKCEKYCHGQGMGNRVVNALLELMTKNGAVVESIQDWDDVQKLSLSVLTKFLICAEYIQNYCSSMCLLPREGYDSLLGIGMGLGLGLEGEKGTNQLQVLGQVLIHSLFGGMLRPSWTEGQDDDRSILFPMSCIGLLSVLHRTGIVPLSSYDYDNMDSYALLRDELVNFHKLLVGNVGRNQSDGQFAYTSMIVSLWTMLPTFDREGQDEETIVVESSMVAKLLDAVFSLNDCQKKSDHHARQSGATQVLIHLCWSRNGSLYTNIQNHGIDNVVEKFVHGLSAKTCGSNDFVVFELSLFAMIYLHHMLGSLIRKTLKLKLEEQNGSHLENFLRNIIDSSRKRFISFVPSVLFLKSIIFQNGSDGQFKIRDRLADDALEVLVIKSSMMDMLRHHLSYYLRTKQIIRLHITVDALHFFHNEAKHKSDFSNLIKDDTVEALVKIITGSIDMTDSLPSVRTSLQITSASILSNLMSNSNIDNKASLKALLFRFATNSMERNFSGMGGLEYAMTQTCSRDLLRRALNFQAKVSNITGEDAFHTASVLFSNVIDKSKLNSRLVHRLERQAKDLERMHIQNKSLAMDRDSLLMKLDSTRLSFDRELAVRLSAAKAEAIDIVEAQTEERERLEMTVSTLEDKLSLERESMKRALGDAHEETKLANRKLEEYEELSNVLQNRLSLSEKILAETDSKLVDANAKIEEYKKAQERSSSENNKLTQENNQLKAKLEETLIQLISLTQIFTMKEKEHKSEFKSVMNDLDGAKMTIDTEVEKRFQLEEKYSLVKGKYQASKHRYKEVVKQRNEERLRYEDDLKRERIRRQDNETKSKRSSETRRPMGTIDFVNSFHDTSLLRSDHNSKTKKSSSSRIDGKSGRSGFRIIK